MAAVAKRRRSHSDAAFNSNKQYIIYSDAALVSLAFLSAALSPSRASLSAGCPVCWLLYVLAALCVGCSCAPLPCPCRIEIDLRLGAAFTRFQTIFLAKAFDDLQSKVALCTNNPKP